MDSFEREYHRFFEKRQRPPTLFMDTFIAQCAMSEIYRTWHRILDYSSISPNSVLYQSLQKAGPHFPLMLRYLAEKTRKKSFKWECEHGFLFLAHIFSPSPKSYAISLLDQNATFPFVSDTDVDTADPIHSIPFTPLVKKCKGTKKAIIRHQISTLDFVHAVRWNNAHQRSRVVIQSSLKQKHLRMYLIKTKKVILSTSIVKRLLYESSNLKYSFFTFPLHFKMFKWPAFHISCCTPFFLLLLPLFFFHSASAHRLTIFHHGCSSNAH